MSPLVSTATDVSLEPEPDTALATVGAASDNALTLVRARRRAPALPSALPESTANPATGDQSTARSRTGAGSAPITPSSSSQSASQGAAPIESQQILGNIADKGAEILKLADSGYELFAVVGLSQHGKSEFMLSMRDEVAERFGGQKPPAPLDNDGRVKANDPGTYYGWRLRAGSRLMVMWDVAGENFRELATQNQASQSANLLDFVSAVLPRCKGIVLTIALHKLWDAWNKPEPDGLVAARVALDRSINTYVRFLHLARLALSGRHQKELNASLLGQDDKIQRLLATTGPLRIPVIVNFSMADRYDKLKSPNGKAPSGLGVSGRELPSRIIEPREDDPLIVLYLYLHQLFQALAADAKWFKADFSHSYDGGTSNAVPDPKIGRSALSMYELLADMNWNVPGLTMRSFLRWHMRSSSWTTGVQQILARAAQTK